MATGDMLPDTDHVVRHGGALKVKAGVALGTAFLLRDGESALSVNWLEHVNAHGARLEQCRVVKSDLIASGRTVRPNDWFIVLRVGTITAITELAGTAWRFLAVHFPKPKNDSHSEIEGLPAVNSQLAALAGTTLADSVTEDPIQCKHV